MNIEGNYKRQSIIFDMDDTLAHFVVPVLGELKRIMGRELSADQMTAGSWLHNFLTKEELDAFLPYVFNRSFYSELEPTAIVDQRRSPEYKNLQQAFDFHVVTARGVALGQDAHRATSDWLYVYSMNMQGITITHPDQKKSQVFPRNAHAILDDSGKVILDAAEHGLQCFLIDQPWNRHIKEDEHPNVHRVTHENALSVMAEHLL